MRKYNMGKYSNNIRGFFDYLVFDYKYELKEYKELEYGHLTIYGSEEIRVYLNYDYMDNFYYFVLLKGENAQFPCDEDDENVRTFFELFQKYEPKLDFKKLQPDDNQYLEALKLNADLLRKYGDKVLKGEEWI